MKQLSRHSWSGAWWRSWLIGLAALVIFAGYVVLALVFGTQWAARWLIDQSEAGEHHSTAVVTSAEVLQEEDALRSSILQATGGVLLFLGGVFTWLQIRNGKEQLEVERQRQITERFTRAVDQLGSESADVRTGGLYALRRIAEESERDTLAVLSTIQAFVRLRAQAREGERSEVSSEVEIGVTLLCEICGEMARQHINLSGLDLRGIRLNHITMKGINWDDSDLRQCELDRLNISNSSFAGTKFSGGTLSAIDISHSDLSGADFVETNVHGAEFSDCTMTQMKFIDAQALALTCDGVRLMDAQFNRAQLRGSSFRRADLRGTTFDGADLRGCRFDFANMADVSLIGADTRGAVFPE